MLCEENSKLELQMHENSKLRDENSVLRQQNASVQSENTLLREEVSSLKNELADQVGQVEALRVQLEACSGPREEEFRNIMHFQYRAQDRAQAAEVKLKEALSE